MYLGDFGMVTKYKIEDVAPNKKCANNGTLNYIALDGHIGSKYWFNSLEQSIFKTVF